MGLGLASLISGCTLIFTSPPERAIKSAVSRAQKRPTENLHAVAALNAFKSKEGVAALGEKLSKVTSIDPAQPIRSDQGDQGKGHVGDVTRVFSAKVSGITKSGAPATYEAQITCAVTYEEEHTDYMQGTCRLDPNNPGGPDQCDPDTPASDWEGEVQRCRVSDLVAATAE